jgi:hypothetical protein
MYDKRNNTIDESYGVNKITKPIERNTIPFKPKDIKPVGK